jgi:hypothetical protein
MLPTALLAASCGGASSPAALPSERDSLVGAWRSQIHFSGGALAQMKGLEFMYVFNEGGTMTESSNYDGAPPVPPAYGLWRKSGPRQFEAKYVFYSTKPPENLEEIVKGGGWLPAGHGVLLERITLSEDGVTFESRIAYTAFDPAGEPVPGAGEGQGRGVRIRFERMK